MKTFRYNEKFGFSRPLVLDEQGYEIVATSFNHYVKEVYKIRSREGGDLRPNWKDRLATSFCNKHLLDGCQETDISVRKISLSDLHEFYKAMKRWKRNKGSLVTSAVAEKRASICSSCPKNVPVVGCFGCSNILPQILKMTKGASTSRDAELKGCAVCGCALRSLVHMPLSIKEHTAKSLKHYPDSCWQKLEFES